MILNESFLCLLHDVARRSTQVVRQAEPRTHFDEHLHRIHSPAQLADGVIPRKDVVIVMEALAPSGVRDPHVLARLDFGIVRPLAPHVRRGVDEPSRVERHDVSTKAARQESADPRVADDVMADERWEGETKEEVEKRIVPVARR